MLAVDFCDIRGTHTNLNAVYLVVDSIKVFLGGPRSSKSGLAFANRDTDNLPGLHTSYLVYGVPTATLFCV